MRDKLLVGAIQIREAAERASPNARSRDLGKPMTLTRGHWATTVSSNTLSAANRIVVPCRT
jgi:hypothetical protein